MTLPSGTAVPGSASVSPCWSLGLFSSKSRQGGVPCPATRQAGPPQPSGRWVGTPSQDLALRLRPARRSAEHRGLTSWWAGCPLCAAAWGASGSSAEWSPSTESVLRPGHHVLQEKQVAGPLMPRGLRVDFRPSTACLPTRLRGSAPWEGRTTTASAREAVQATGGGPARMARSEPGYGPCAPGCGERHRAVPSWAAAKPP